MDNSMNLLAMLIPDGIAIVLMIIVYQSNYVILKTDDKRSAIIIRRMMNVVILTCLMDSLAVILENNTAPWAWFFSIIANNWVVLANVVIGWLWIYLVSYALMIPVEKPQRIFMIAMFLVGAVILIVNFFEPIVFVVDENCVYHRRFMFFICPLIGGIYILDGLLIFFIARMRGGALKFFPLKEMLFPIIVGVLVQCLFFGVSTIWPGMALSVAAFVFSAQNKTMFRDKLTGVYNRFYLDNLKEEAMRQRGKNAFYTFVMIDLNDFKSINDRFGHSVGDQALIVFAEILASYAGQIGTVIRYAGDEFVVILNTKNEQLVKSILKRIRSGLDDFNRGQAPYQLSAAYGYFVSDLKKQSVDEIMNEVDRKMYKDKKRFYMMNPYL